METSRKLVLVGSRGSALALKQTDEVLEKLRAEHGETLEFRVSAVTTKADASPEAPLASLDQGMFVSEIEMALLAGEISMAVHSLKDMTTGLPDGLIIGGVCPRLDVRDVLVNRWGCSLEELPPGARIGTSSPRRAAELKSLRSDVQVLPIRGNVDTRLRKAKGPDYDGVILAAAGVIRMGLEDEVAQFLSPTDFVPAPGQGALAVELRRDDDEMISLVKHVDHPQTRGEVMAERAFLEALGSGCQVPAGAYARSDGSTVVMTVFLGEEDGSRVFRTKVRGRADNPHEVALDAYQRLIEGGAKDLLGR